MTTSNRARTLAPAAAPSSEAPPHASHPLPDEPLIVIEPRRTRIDLRGAWAYRELLWFMMWRDVKVRYKQTALGVVWVVLQPLLMMSLFTLFFGRLVGIKTDGGVPYALFAYAGLVPWTYFAAAASGGANSTVNHAQLITKVYFPRLLMPAAAVGAVLVDLAISSSVLVLLMVYWRVPPTPGLLLLPVLVLLMVALALGFGLLASALNVKYRDVRLALPFLIQVWFFCSPIIYPVSIIPERWQWLIKLNPMTGIVEGFRAALYGGGRFDWPALGASAAITAALLVVGALTFNRMEKGFADVI